MASRISYSAEEAATRTNDGDEVNNSLGNSARSRVAIQLKEIWIETLVHPAWFMRDTFIRDSY